MRAVLFACLSCLPMALATGCSAPPPSTASRAKGSNAHPYRGPNGGELIELGDKFYAELVVNEITHEVSIGILDKAAKNPFPIAAKVIFVSLKHQGKPEAYELQASARLTDAEGKASRFVLTEGRHLHADLEQVEADARLEVTIDGQSFGGRIARHRKSFPRGK